MIDREVALLLGVAIALVSSIVTVLVQHLLSLRAERIKREQDKKEKEAGELRKPLLGDIAFRAQMVEVENGEATAPKELIEEAVGEPETQPEAKECPVVQIAGDLARQIEAQELPEDFDSGDMSYNLLLPHIRHEYTNCGKLLRDLPLCADLRDQGIECYFEGEGKECPSMRKARDILKRAAKDAAEEIYLKWERKHGVLDITRTHISPKRTVE
jgi:hypothetical protein